MLAADAAINPDDLYTISAGGFSATADAFARDPDSEGLWFLSMVGAQSALKAIWAALLKRPRRAPTCSPAPTASPSRAASTAARFPARPWGRGRRRSPACP